MHITSSSPLKEEFSFINQTTLMGPNAAIDASRLVKPRTPRLPYKFKSPVVRLSKDHAHFISKVLLFVEIVLKRESQCYYPKDKHQYLNKKIVLFDKRLNLKRILWHYNKRIDEQFCQKNTQSVIKWIEKNKEPNWDKFTLILTSKYLSLPLPYKSLKEDLNRFKNSRVKVIPLENYPFLSNLSNIVPQPDLNQIRVNNPLKVEGDEDEWSKIEKDFIYCYSALFYIRSLISNTHINKNEIGIEELDEIFVSVHQSIAKKDSGYACSNEDEEILKYIRSKFPGDIEDEIFTINTLLKWKHLLPAERQKECEENVHFFYLNDSLNDFLPRVKKIYDLKRLENFLSI